VPAAVTPGILHAGAEHAAAALINGGGHLGQPVRVE
jgi:hypothetical protein